MTVTIKWDVATMKEYQWCDKCLEHASRDNHYWRDYHEYGWCKLRRIVTIHQKAFKFAEIKRWQS